MVTPWHKCLKAYPLPQWEELEMTLLAEGKKRGQFERHDRSPVGGLPSVVDTFPVGVLADEIRKPDRERVTALIVWGSNPVLNCPNPSGRLEDTLVESV